MSLIKRYIDINFDVDARPLKRVPGTIVQGNNKVNVLRITYPNISSDHVVVALTQRADQVTGSTFLNYSHENDCFELILHNWFTAVSGELQITFAIYSQTPEINEEGIITTETDTLRKVYLNVEESISAELPAPEDESIFLDVAVMVKSYDARIEELLYRVENLENFNDVYITSYDELDNYTIPGIYKFNFRDSKVFNLFVVKQNQNTVIQIRSSNDGYYLRRYYIEGGSFEEWIYFEYSVNGSVSQWQSDIYYRRGEMVRQNEVYVCITDCKGYDPEEDNESEPLYWVRFQPENYVLREELNDYIKKDDRNLDESIYLDYNSFDLYATDEETEERTSISLYPSETYISSNGEGYCSIYLASDGRIDIDGNEVNINGKSFDKLYDDVAMLKGDYSSIDYISELTYTFIIPENIEKYAFISQVGGMCHKTKNLIVIDDVAETTNSNGITYKVENGVITLNGTATKAHSIPFTLKNPIPAGTYVLENFGDYNSQSKGVAGLADSSYNMLLQVNMNALPQYIQKTITNECVRVNVYPNSGAVFNNLKLRLMCVDGSRPSNFEAGFEGIKKAPVTEINHTNRNILAGMRETENGYISANDGSITSSTSCKSYDYYYVGTKNQILVMIENFESLTNSYACRIGMYDESMNFLGFISITAYANLYVLNRNTRYIRFSTDKFAKKVLISFDTTFNYTAPENYDVIHLSGIRYSELYDDYGVGINESCYNYISFDKGVFIKNVGQYTFTGKETFNQGTSSTVSGQYRYSTPALKNLIKPAPANSEKGNIMMAELETRSIWNIDACIEGVSVNVGGDISFYKKDKQTADDMKVYLTGKTIYYELLEPVEKAITEIDTFIEVEKGDIITFKNDNNKEIPVGIEYIEVG